MCKCLPKSTVTSACIILTVLMGLISIPCIVLSGVDYQQTDMRWASIGSWFRTGPLKVGCIVVVFASMLIGLPAFTCASKSKPMTAIFVVVNGLSTLLTFSVSVFVLVASEMGESSAAKACSDKSSGLFEHFAILDKYFEKIDQKLCSSACECRFTNDSAIEDFQQNPNYLYEYQNYAVTKDKKKGAIQIQNCLAAVNSIRNELNNDLNFFKLIGDQSESSFNQLNTYWGRIEESFKCTGWCTKSYTANGTPHYLYKYLFSDINGGPVRNTCMAPVMKWIKKTLKAYGGLGIIISVVQAVLWALALSLLADLTGDSKSQRNTIEIEQQ